VAENKQQSPEGEWITVATVGGKKKKQAPPSPSKKTQQPQQQTNTRKEENTSSSSSSSNNKSSSELNDTQIPQLMIFLQEKKQALTPENCNSINQTLLDYQTFFSGPPNGSLIYFFDAKKADGIYVGWALNKDLSQTQTAIPPPYDSVQTHHGFSQTRYTSLLASSLEARKQVGLGNSALLKALYKFWSHFLRQQFNKQMYQDFKTLALEDLSAKSTYGLNQLIRFYANFLPSHFKPDLFKDFQDATLKDSQSGNGYALKHLTKFIQNRKDLLAKFPSEVNKLLKFEDAQQPKSGNTNAWALKRNS
jgi:hypothetical protein